MIINYQKASADDLPKIFEISEEIWKPAFAPIYSPKELNVLYHGMYNKELLVTWLSITSNHFYFILNDKKFIGYMAVELHPTHLKLDKIYVHQSLQGNGIGSQVMLKVESFAREASLKQIMLRVNRQNRSAIDFYRKRNFHILESINIPGPNQLVYEDYLMVKSLKN